MINDNRCYAKKLFIGLIAVLAVFVTGFAALAQAGGVSKYDIHDWVAAQGSEFDVDGDGTWENWLSAGYDVNGNMDQTGGDLYVPPSNNYIGWIAPATNHIGSVDYAGVAAKYLKASCGADLGTTFNGSVSVRDVGDGRVLVSVLLKTKNALAWGIDAIDLNGDGVVDYRDWLFDDRQPLYFGARVTDICAGASPSLANVEANFEYYVKAGDNPLVDIATFNYAFRKMMFRSTAIGTLADGATPARMTIVQTGILMPHSHSQKYDGFPVESVEFQIMGAGR